MKLHLPTKKQLRFWLTLVIFGLLGEAGPAQSKRSALSRVWIDIESCGMNLYKGGYMNWSVTLSLVYALENDGSTRRFWRRPAFGHTDPQKEFRTNIPLELRHGG